MDITKRNVVLQQCLHTEAGELYYKTLEDLYEEIDPETINKIMIEFMVMNNEIGASEEEMELIYQILGQEVEPVEEKKPRKKYTKKNSPEVEANGDTE